MNLPICDKLQKLKEEGRIPFHMPGHKRKPNAVFGDIVSMDITEITDYDNLHHPQGMILESMNQLKDIYGSKKSWYLVNGSTVGILAAISSVCQPGDKIMLARNCHKAVYNAIRLLHLRPVYLYPSYNEEYDMLQGIDHTEIEEMKKLLSIHQDTKAVIITSPTYEGVVSDIAAIKEITQLYQIPLIVDEAHGAHFISHEYFPKSAVEMGADIVIQSAHKTLPSFTQTALLHLSSDMVAPEKIDEMLSIYETSSPSYLLMASAEYGVFYAQNHEDILNEYVDNLRFFRKRCAQLKHIHLLGPEDVKGYDYDRGKLVFVMKHSSMDGGQLFRKMLQEYHIEFEMETAMYCIAMTSINDTAEEFRKLADAIYLVDQELSMREADEEKKGSIFMHRPEQKYLVWETISRKKEEIYFQDSAGRISGDYVYLYPPGIPILVPGEKITKEIVENMNYYLYNGYNVPALEEGMISVLSNQTNEE